MGFVDFTGEPFPGLPGVGEPTPQRSPAGVHAPLSGLQFVDEVPSEPVQHLLRVPAPSRYLAVLTNLSRSGSVALNWRSTRFTAFRRTLPPLLGGEDSGPDGSSGDCRRSSQDCSSHERHS